MLRKTDLGLFVETLTHKKPDFLFHSFRNASVKKDGKYFYDPLKHLRVLFERIYVLIFSAVIKIAAFKHFMADGNFSRDFYGSDFSSFSSRPSVCLLK